MTGDRYVLLVATRKPWRWRRYLQAWTKANVEWVVCSTVLGSGGLLTIARDYGEYGDVLAIVTDIDSREWIAGEQLYDPGLPKCLIVDVLPKVLAGDVDTYWRREAAINAAWKEQGWPGIRSLCSPTPTEFVAWCVGWWAAQEAAK